ncbi:chorismate--pyruvate lyase family protein [Neptunicella marina]|uniref:Probable chorismate pyruvate-lyase n=1 Tax=Neptunicella marina TaxID=2125989 RepID=A0A8J6IUL1_9ALTE|nr:chorismate lyase [Neptunicella marina]MBC3765911.1 chorismate lyase [Neptunicella marina]
MTKLVSFPLDCSPQWLSAESLKIPDPLLKNWLLDTGSLTERLQAHTRHFRVELLGQQTLDIKQDEQTALQSKHKKAVVREVLLQGEQQNWVFAHSLMTPNINDDNCRSLTELGNQPLGKVIFNDNCFTRSPFELCRLNGGSRLHYLLGINESLELWGRRSLFSFEHYGILVAEIFLPSAPAYKNQMEYTRG